MLGHRGSIRASKVTPTRRTLGQGESCDELLAPSNPARTTSEELITVRVNLFETISSLI
jgi:hypothetical protein